MKMGEQYGRYQVAQMESDMKLARVLSDAHGLVTAVKDTEQTTFVREQAKRLERALRNYREALDTEREEKRKYQQKIEELKGERT